jgi:glycerate kinase
LKKVILIPDSFKGTMSSGEVCAIMADAVHRFHPAAVTVAIPVADGGEGSVDAFLAALGGTKVTVDVTGPWGTKITSFYGVLADNKSDNSTTDTDKCTTGTTKTAVIELAAAAGLPLAETTTTGTLDPEKTTTLGVGELVTAALDAGATKIILGLGGSATNDGGCGLASALGVTFTNAAGTPFVPTGGTLKDIVAISTTTIDPRLKTVDLVTMCDIDNPLCGPTGAAAVFGPQKGADSAMVTRLDAGLAHLAAIVKRDIGVDFADMGGAGAAGGAGFAMKAFFNSRIQMGIETVLDTVGFDALLADTDIVFSGEGKIDTQSIRGKVVVGIAKRTKRAGVPLIAVVGDIGDGIDEAYDIGVTAIFSINRVAVEYPAAKKRAKGDLGATMDNIMRLLISAGR